MKTRYSVLCLLVFLLTTFFSAAQKKESKYIREGNREFEKARFDNSEVLYRRAVEEARSPDRANFNIGDALYKQEKYEDAVAQFQKVAEQDDIDDIARAWTYHNIGNSLLQSKKLEESIEAYKKSLRKNPDDLETKYNLAWAQDKLKEQQKQQQQDKNKDQNKDQDQNKDKQDQQNKQDQDKDQQENQQPQPNQLSKEDAQRILQAMQAQENEVQEKVKKAKAQKAKVKTVINW